jgi:hypothetical protein
MYIKNESLGKVRQKQEGENMRELFPFFVAVINKKQSLCLLQVNVLS